MAKKYELVPIVTGFGDIMYVNISGKGKRNFNDDGDEFTATVHLKGEAAKETIAKIDELIAQGPKDLELVSKGYKELLVDEAGKLYSPNKHGKVKVKTKNDDGEVVSTDITSTLKPSGVFAVTMKTQTTFQDGKTKKIIVQNAKAKTVELGERKVGNGTTGALSGKMKIYTQKDDWGIALFLSGLQITKFVKYEGDAGFEAQDDGFEDFEDDDLETEEAAETATAEPKAKANIKL